ADGVDLVYTIEVNTWQGQRNLQLEIKEVIKESKELTQGRELNFELVDWRDWYNRGREFPEFNDALYYYEGLNDDWPVDIINRYSARQADNLVLLSCPPDLQVLEDILYTVNPQQVILAYSQQDLGSSKKFIKHLAGLVKYIVEDKQGITDIYTLAFLTGERELTVTLGLKYLQFQGQIRVQFVGPDKILLARASTSRGINSKGNLQELLGESRSFREYMLNKSMELISELINSNKKI
ncbi:MAG: hypothetical protein ACQEP9_07510, partial [Bacillota bacterium]